jgi:hypothetical protein
LGVASVGQTCTISRLLHGVGTIDPVCVLAPAAGAAGAHRAPVANYCWLALRRRWSMVALRQERESDYEWIAGLRHALCVGATLIIALALAAAALPVHRAAKVGSMVALRYE